VNARRLAIASLVLGTLLAFAPAGQRSAVGAPAEGATAASAARPVVLARHWAPVTAVALDGNVLAWAGQGQRRYPIVRARMLPSGRAHTPLAWSPDGRSIVARDRDDLVTLAVAGGRRRTVLAGRLADLRCGPHVRAGAASWSPAGARVYYAAATGRADGACLVLSVRRGGTDRRELGVGDFATLSPDGRLLATGRAGTISVMRLDGSLVGGPWPGTAPSWSSDSSGLAYVEGRRVHVRDADGGNARALTAKGSEAWNPQWRPRPRASRSSEPPHREDGQG
jgi:hypothetical protein